MKIKTVFVMSVVAAIGWRVGNTLITLTAKKLEKACDESISRLEREFAESTATIMEVKEP